MIKKSMKISPIIKAGEALKLEPENIVIIDSGSGRPAYESYQRKHLKDALYADLNEDLAEIPENAKNGGRHPLPDLEKFSVLLQTLGIDANSHVIIYDDIFPEAFHGTGIHLLQSCGKHEVSEGNIRLFSGPNFCFRPALILGITLNAFTEQIEIFYRNFPDIGNMAEISVNITSVHRFFRNDHD